MNSDTQAGYEMALALAEAKIERMEADLQARKVIVSHMQSKQQPGNGRNVWVLEETGEATFHQFGVGYEEFEAGPGNFTTAIVEWPDGRVESVPVDHVRFVTPNVELRRGRESD